MLARHLRRWLLPAPPPAPMICRMIFDELCVLANGDIVCSCGDPSGRQVYGNVLRDRIGDVYDGPLYRQARRAQLSAPPSSVCPVVGGPCGGRVSRPTADDRPEGRQVRVLQLEPTSRCGVRCPSCPVTHFTQDPAYRSDRTSDLPLAAMLDVVHQLPCLEKILFYNFGEPFLHPDAIPFLRAVRSRRPDVLIHISTNGLALTPAKIGAIAAEALVDRIVFSIDGASQESYGRYRVGGSWRRALGALRELSEACARYGTHGRVDLVWQYILFEWNDSEAEIEAAQRLAATLGVRLEWILTHTPGASRRFGEASETTRALLGGRAFNALTCDRRARSLWEHGGIAQGFYAARVAVRAQVVEATPGGRFALPLAIGNASPSCWPTEGPNAVRVGIRLETLEGRALRELHGIPLPERCADPGGRSWVFADGVAPPEPGRYRLFFDLVHEGVTWFSDRSSTPAVCRLEVRPAAGQADWTEQGLRAVFRHVASRPPHEDELSRWRESLASGVSTEVLINDLARLLPAPDRWCRAERARRHLLDAYSPGPLPRLEL